MILEENLLYRQMTKTLNCPKKSIIRFHLSSRASNINEPYIDRPRFEDELLRKKVEWLSR